MLVSGADERPGSREQPEPRRGSEWGHRPGVGRHPEGGTGTGGLKALTDAPSSAAVCQRGPGGTGSAACRGLPRGLA